MRRRELLATTGLVALSGCTNNVLGSTPTTTTEPPPDRDNDDVPDSEDDYPNEYIRAHRVKHIEDTVTLAADDFTSYRFKISGELAILKYIVSVPSGTGIDVFVMKRDSYLKYNDGKETSYLTPYSMLNIDDGVMEGKPIDKGRYRLVIDNTNYGTDIKSPNVKVNVTLDIAIPGGE